MAYNISYIYQIIDRFSPALKKINAARGTFTTGMKKTGTALKNLSGKMASIQGAATTLATAVGGKIALDKFVGFDAAMNKLESVTYAGSGQMKQMREMAKELGATTQFTAGQAAEGMTYLAMAGLKTEDVLKAIPGALQLAAAGNLDLGTAADIATNVLGQMGLKVKDLTHVNDVLALAQSRANFNITELFEAIRPVGTTAKNLGINLEELTSYLGAMANAGEKGSIAGTLLRNAFTELAAPTGKQIKIYKKLGLNLSEFISRSGKITNFKALLNQLRKLNEDGKLSVGTLQELYGERGFRAIQILAGKAGEGVEELEKALIHSQGAAAKAAKIQMKGLPGALKALSSAFEAATVAIFESGLDKIIIAIAEAVSFLARTFSKFSPVVLLIIGVLGGLIVVMAPLLMMFAFMSSAITGLAAAFEITTAALLGIIGTIGIFVVAFVAVGAAIYQVWKNWDYLVQDFKAGIKWLIESEWYLVAFGPIGMAIKAIKANWDDLVNEFRRGVEFIKNAIAEVKEGFNVVGKGFKGAGVKVKEIVTDNWLTRKLGLSKEKPLTGPGVAAQNTVATQSTLNGSITVAAEKGSAVKQTRMKTDVPGNLGFNMAAVGM